VLSSSSNYIYDKGSRGAGLPYENIIKNSYFFILKQWYMHTYTHTYLGPTYYGISVCMDAYMLEYF